MKVKVRRRKPAPIGPKQQAFRSTIEVLRELVPKYGIPKTSWFDSYNKESMRKQPAPVAVEQAIKALCDTKTNYYSVIQKRLLDSGEFITGDNLDISRKKLKNNYIHEAEFIEMIDKIHHVVHHPRVKNVKTKLYPDIKISELLQVLCLS